MSFAGCSTSALKAPTIYPYGSVGTVIRPTILSVVTDSNASVEAFSPFVLPRGVWHLAGCIGLDPVQESETFAVMGVQCLLDGSDSQGFVSIPGGDNFGGLTVSWIIVSDGTNVLSVEPSAVTSGATQWRVVTGDASVLKLVRVA